MPHFVALNDDCDHEQIIGKTTARRARTSRMGEGLTLYCTECETFHGFQKKQRGS